MQTLAEFAYRLAQILLDGPWNKSSLCARASAMFVQQPHWFARLARRLCVEHSALRRPSLSRLTERLRSYPPLQRGWHQLANHPFNQSPNRSFAPDTWQLPQINSAAQLADWLALPLGQLDWFVDLRWLNSQPPPSKLSHYHSTWQTKRRSGARLIEAPKSRLVALQRRVLHEILDKIPPHDAAHGFVPGRSVVTSARPHVGQAVILRCDLRDFFPSIHFARVIGIYLTAGYPSQVAYRLAALSCRVTPELVFDNFPGTRSELQQARSLYRRPHLPQGAPTSPALANRCAFRLDCRLNGLAESAGAHFTHYADDLLFSGDESFSRALRRFVPQVIAIAIEEGFEINRHKSRVMRQGVRQIATGIVLNEKLNVPRDEFDQLKATLHNAVRFGPESQNRTNRADFRNHLAGRIVWIEQLNPARAQKLRRLFDRISWPQAVQPNHEES